MSSPNIIEFPNIDAPGKIGNNNALTHGGTSRKLILPGENQADFESLLADLQAEYQPETPQHRLFLEQLAMGHWFLWRRQRACNAIEASVYESAGDDPENLSEEHFRRLHLAERYKVAAERALKRAFQNAESIRKGRKADRDYRERHARWEAAQEIRQRRLALQEEKQKADETRKQQRAAREAALNPPPRPPIQWPERAGRKVLREEPDQAAARKLADSRK
jgi:hypothetical protein